MLGDFNDWRKIKTSIVFKNSKLLTSLVVSNHYTHKYGVTNNDNCNDYCMMVFQL